MNTKYHYEVYAQDEPREIATCRRSVDGKPAHFKNYEEAVTFQGVVNKAYGVDQYVIDKWRTVSPNFADLPIAKTYEEAVQVIKDGGSLWHEHIDCDEDDPDCGDGCCIGTDDLETLATETEDGKEFETNHYHMEGSVAPPSERLGECVDGDLEAPLECKVCDKGLWKGDTVFIDALGYIDNEGYPEANQDQSYEAMCVDCQRRISDAIDDVKEKIAYEKANKS